MWNGDSEMLAAKLRHSVCDAIKPVGSVAPGANAVSACRLAAGAAMAMRVRVEIEAEALRLMNEAHNMLSPEARMSALRMRLVEKAEAIIRESVRPMERIEGIKILHVDGLGGSSGHSGDMANGGGGNFSDGLVNSALRFRAQAPLVDQLLREIGLEGGDIQRLVGGASGAQSALPPASPKPPKGE